MTIPLTMARGDVWASGTMGAAPVDVRGATFETPQGTRLRLVRNGGTTTLSGCEAVEYMSADPTVFDVQENSTAKNDAIAGVVDHVYAEKGKTIAKGDLFWIVEHGPGYILSSGTSIATGDRLASAAGTGLADQATLSAVAAVALETQASTAKSTLAFMRL